MGTRLGRPVLGSLGWGRLFQGWYQTQVAACSQISRQPHHKRMQKTNANKCKNNANGNAKSCKHKQKA